ncbi:MAG: hypothetical protein Q9174_004783 [Haloplaca sp. 1 TL-2023]
MVVLIFFFESGIFSIIFAMCIRGLGRRTKMGSVLLTASTSGGAIIPVIMSAVSDSRGIPYGYCIPLALFAFGLLLPVYTTVIPAARHQVDPSHTRSDDGESSPSEGSNMSKGFGRVISNVVKRKKWPTDSPTADDMDEKSKEAPG